jgi:hypothetical protein
LALEASYLLDFSTLPTHPFPHLANAGVEYT